jgi:hypothetical protein
MPAHVELRQMGIQDRQTTLARIEIDTAWYAMQDASYDNFSSDKENALQTKKACSCYLACVAWAFPAAMQYLC